MKIFQIDLTRGDNFNTFAKFYELSREVHNRLWTAELLLATVYRRILQAAEKSSSSSQS
jgi:hypothetical protein